MKAHNTHYATSDELARLARADPLEYLRVLINTDLHDLQSDKFSLLLMSPEAIRGYKLAMAGVLGALNFLQGRSSSNDDI